MPTAPGPLGFISVKDRTANQLAAGHAAMKRFGPLTIANKVTPKAPVKVILTKAFEDPTVKADIGFVFNGYRQLSGSCVGVSAGDAIATLSAVQRLFSSGATKAFVPWWCYPYGRTRYNEGDRGPGEGAIDSVMADTLIREGCFAVGEGTGLPTFDTSDGLALPSSVEMAYSDGASTLNTKYSSLAKQHPLGAAAVCNSTQDIWDAITNGYPVLDGCDNYIGSGTIQSGVAIGTYDGRGGHSTCYIGVWDHPVLGRLFNYWNQWDQRTYPEDGSGKPRCSVWAKETTVAKLFTTGGGGGETIALSHLTYFPAQPAILDWVNIQP